MEIAMKTQKKANEHASRVPFTSMCPACGQMRPQDGYDRGSLLRLLRGGYPVEAYCAACNEYWPVSIKERAALCAAAIQEAVI